MRRDACSRFSDEDLIFSYGQEIAEEECAYREDAYYPGYRLILKTGQVSRGSWLHNQLALRWPNYGPMVFGHHATLVYYYIAQANPVLLTKICEFDVHKGIGNGPIWNNMITDIMGGGWLWTSEWSVHGTGACRKMCSHITPQHFSNPVERDYHWIGKFYVIEQDRWQELRLMPVDTPTFRDMHTDAFLESWCRAIAQQEREVFGNNVVWQDIWSAVADRAFTQIEDVYAMESEVEFIGLRDPSSISDTIISTVGKGLARTIGGRKQKCVPTYPCPPERVQ